MKSLLPVALLLLFPASAFSQLSLHPLFSDNMVLQRERVVRVWGEAAVDSEIVVRFAQQELTAEVGDEGVWVVELQPMAASAEPQSLVVTSGDRELRVDNVLIGDVWLCGGQSNMEFSLERIYQGDIEIASARHSAIRLMTVPAGTSPQVQTSFEALNEFNSWNNEYELKGSWLVCSPESVKKFASIGYIFARRLHLASGVPIGIIDNSVGGTTVEAWTSRESLEQIPAAAGLLEDWDARIAAWDAEQDLVDRVERWERETARRREQGQEPKPKPDDLRPGPAFDRNNPGASYNSMLACLAGFEIKGAIFHQGYNNALGDSRPQLYAETFQSMIGDWRKVFHNEAMPFGIIELCAGADPQTIDNFELMMVDAGPYIREAQFQAYLELANIGWASAHDQQVNWYHPQMKVQLAERIARWALATQYGLRIGHEPARLVEQVVDDGAIIVEFDRQVTVRDGRPIAGMAIAGDDRRFYPAEASFFSTGKDDRGREIIDRQRIRVSSPFVEEPVAVRYAWARCPLGNLTNLSHMERILPVPSFRTDTWDWGDAPFGSDQSETRQRRNERRAQAQANIEDRQLREARRVLDATGKE